MLEPFAARAITAVVVRPLFDCTQFLPPSLETYTPPEDELPSSNEPALINEVADPDAKPFPAGIHIVPLSVDMNAPKVPGPTKSVAPTVASMPMSRLINPEFTGFQFDPPSELLKMPAPPVPANTSGPIAVNALMLRFVIPDDRKDQDPPLSVDAKTPPPYTEPA